MDHPNGTFVPSLRRRRSITTGRGRWTLRMTVLVIVAVIHGGIALLIFQPVPLQRSAMSSPHSADALKVRFIKVDVPRKEHPTGHLDPRATQVVTAASEPIPRKTQKSREVIGMTPASSPTAIRNPIATVEASTNAAGDTYVAGGGYLTERSLRGQQNLRIPGGLEPGKERFRMVDPRTQGIAGVIRIIGSFTGAVDPHCLDLEVWRGMTTEERIAHRISADDIDAIENNYHCSAPRNGAAGR